MGAYFLLAAMSAAALQAEAPASETPAQRLTRVAPPYPEACKPAPGESAEAERVVVAYNVTRIGRVERARVRESTNSCLDETVISTVGNWRFEPRRVDGKAQPQNALETIFTFILDAETTSDDFDVRPISQMQVGYPEKCYARADDREVITVGFNVSQTGQPTALHIVESTNECLDNAALESVEQWRYRPQLVDGAPIERKNVHTTLTYAKSDKLLRGRDVRKSLDSQLARIEKRIRNEDDYSDQALVDLAVMEQKFGKTASSEELWVFHHVRGLARIKAHDFAGALDDLRDVQNSYLTPEGEESIRNLIAQIEAIVASQDTRAAAPEEEGRAADGSQNQP